MKRPELASDEIYHVYNRGVEKRAIFMNDKDYLRFIHDLFEFNDAAPVLNVDDRFARKPIGDETEIIKVPRKPRRLLVDLLVFCLMPNHYHLIVRQRVDDGVATFMQKLGTGYTMSFNRKYQRVGSLFQGSYRAVHLSREEHFHYLPHYIHLNPLDLFMPTWRDRAIRGHQEAMQFLEQYRWSSFPDYINKKNFPSVTQRDFLLSIYGGTRGYRAEILQWLRSHDLRGMEPLLLE